MKTGSNKSRIHEGSYLLQILQKVADATRYSDSESEQNMDAKGNKTLRGWKLELQMTENSIKSEEIGNDLLVHPVFPIPVA